MKLLRKAEAIIRIQKHLELSLDQSNTHFANINSQKDVWWFDIPLRKVSHPDVKQIDLLLYDHRDNDLHLLRIPTEYLRKNLKLLVVRKEKDSVSLELSADEARQFQDVRPKGGRVHFGRFKL
jgi:hypothetical protein